jgi:hypothetical protein
MSVAFVPALALVVVLWPRVILAAATAAPPENFPTQKEAEQHCPADLVVWLDLPSRTYYFRGQQRYGSTKGGAYVCRDEAKGGGMRAAPGSQ